MTALAAPSRLRPAEADKWVVAAAVGLGALLEILDATVVNVALAEIQVSLGATLAQMSWIVASYTIANIVALPLFPWLRSWFGTKRFFLYSLAGFALASALCAASTTLWALAASRVLQGLAGGGLVAKAEAILLETFPREEQPIAQGFFSLVTMIGPMLGITLGGYVVATSSWRWVFLINVPASAVAIAFGLWALPADGPAEGGVPIDWPGLALLAVGLGSLQAVLEEGYAKDWFESPLITALAVAAAAGLALFVRRQLTSAHPIVDLRVLRHPSLAAGSTFSAVLGLALNGALFVVPVFASTVLRLTPLQVGLLMVPGALGGALAMPLVARLVRRADPRLTLLGGLLVLAFAIRWLGRLTTSTGSEQLLWPLVARSVGTILMFVSLSVCTMGSLPKKDIAAGTAFFNLTLELGASVGVALLTTLHGHRAAFHRHALVSHLSVTDANVQRRLSELVEAMAAKGAAPEQARARAALLLDGAVQTQASTMSFNDALALTAALVVGTIPLVLFLKAPARGGRGPEAGGAGGAPWSEKGS